MNEMKEIKEMEEMCASRSYKKAEMIDSLAELGYTKKAANLIINDIVKVVTKALIDCRSVKLHGFGEFTVKKVAERNSVCIKTGENLVIPAHDEVKFVPGKALKRAVKEGFLRE